MFLMTKLGPVPLVEVMASSTMSRKRKLEDASSSSSEDEQPLVEQSSDSESEVEEMEVENEQVKEESRSESEEEPDEGVQGSADNSEAEDEPEKSSSESEVEESEQALVQQSSDSEDEEVPEKSDSESEVEEMEVENEETQVKEDSSSESEEEQDEVDQEKEQVEASSSSESEEEMERVKPVVENSSSSESEEEELESVKPVVYSSSESEDEKEQVKPEVEASSSSESEEEVDSLKPVAESYSSSESEEEVETKAIVKKEKQEETNKQKPREPVKIAMPTDQLKKPVKVEVPTDQPKKLVKEPKKSVKVVKEPKEPKKAVKVADEPKKSVKTAEEPKQKRQKTETTQTEKELSDSEIRMRSVRRMLEPFSREQLVEIMANAATQHDAFYADLKASNSDLIHRKVLVRGMPQDTKPSVLSSTLEAFGNVEGAGVVTSLGIGHITFANVEDAIRVVASRKPLYVDGHKLSCSLGPVRGSHMRTPSPNGPSVPPPPKQRPQQNPQVTRSDVNTTEVFVWGIGDLTVEDLQEEFQKFGEVEMVKVPRDYATKKNKGFGFITFRDEAAAKAALEVTPKEIKGRYFYCKPKVKNN